MAVWFGKGVILVALSVVLPVHNGEAYLDMALASIRSQTFKDFELLVVDDASTDGSAEICARHTLQDRRVQRLANTGSGLVDALNFGVSCARAPLIARMDADDIALPARFERQMAAMATAPDLAVLGTGTARIDAEGRPVDTTTPPTDPEEIARTLLKGNPMAHPTVIMQRSMVEAVGGYRQAYLRAEDYDLWMRIIEVGRIGNLAEPLLNYRIGTGFLPDLLKHQVRSEIAVRASATLRRAGLPDPSDKWSSIDQDRLAELGVDESAVNREITRRGLQMARFLRKLGDQEGFRAALDLADSQPRNEMGAVVDHLLRRAKVFM